MSGLQMISCRVAQGLCGAILLPSCLAIVSSASSEVGLRAKIFAIFGTAMSLGPMVGYVLGGIITQNVSWRGCLFADFVVSLTIAGVAMAFIRSRPAREQTESFNILHALLATLALGLIVFGASRVGGGHSVILSSLVAEGKFVLPGALLLAGYIWAERRSQHPLLHLSLLADRTRGFSLLALMVGGGSVIGVVSMQLSFYMQNVLHYTPVETGIALFPNSIAVVVGNPLTGYLVPTNRGEKDIRPRRIPVEPGSVHAAGDILAH